jgi:hypothetical protein
MRKTTKISKTRVDNYKFETTLDYLSYDVPTGTQRPVSIVLKALTKFCTKEEIKKILKFRRSQFTEKALIDDVYRGNVKHHVVIKDHHYHKALDLTSKMLSPKKKYRPVHFCDLRYYPWTLSTSAELPFTRDEILRKKVREAFERKELPSPKMNKHNLYNHAFVYNRNLVHQIKEGKSGLNSYYYGMIAHARSHLVSEDDPDKIRMVFGVPWLLLMVECMFLWPYFNYLKHNRSLIAWGYEVLDGGFMKIYHDVKGTAFNRTWLALDWSMFDKLARFSVINDVHAIWRANIIMDQGYIPTIDYAITTSNAVRLNRLFTWMINGVKHTPIILPDGRRVRRKHSGIPSGCLRTQLLDTWVNAVMLITCLLAMGYEIDESTYAKVLGDDSLIRLKELVAVEKHPQLLDDFAKEAERRFGSKLNRKKSMISNNLEDLEFLGYNISDGIPKRDPYRLLGQLLFPERHWDIDRLLARSVGICYASAGGSKLVYDVCRDVFNFCKDKGGKPNKLGFKDLKWMLPNIDIDFTKFPTQLEITERLLTPPGISETSYWDKTHFKSEC